ncbi:hypothetical protein OPV22_011763 [Ensete ventricosum]|uniref:Uncharacterized protein n=1 Tax=Ensete ventricosum TaxID=4639 RepID=A0AAV8RE75_ENSVE|nr:hypothetical protein OPV22_011763 [Ensete ventricosum]
MSAAIPLPGLRLHHRSLPILSLTLVLMLTGSLLNTRRGLRQQRLTGSNTPTSRRRRRHPPPPGWSLTPDPDMNSRLTRSFKSDPDSDSIPLYPDSFEVVVPFDVYGACLISPINSLSFLHISGRPSELIELKSVLRGQIPVIRRYSGGQLSGEVLRGYGDFPSLLKWWMKSQAVPALSGSTKLSARQALEDACSSRCEDSR